MSLEDPHHKSDKGSRTNPDPHRYTTETVVKNMCSAMIIINEYENIVHLPVVDPLGNYSHGYTGARGK